MTKTERTAVDRVSRASLSPSLLTVGRYPVLRRFTAQESGQIVPLLAFVVVLLIGAGVLILWLGASTKIATDAQTAADAAALAGERELVHELSTPRYVDGEPVDVSPDPAAIAQQAAGYAQLNNGVLVSSAVIPTPGYGWGYDVTVTVRGRQTLPAHSLAPGKTATARARASTDPFSSPAPTAQSTNPPQCDASSISGPRFSGAPSGPDGFHPIGGANFSFGCEPLLAGRINALAIKLKIKVSGLEGYVSAGSAGVAGGSGATSAHLCGTAAKVLGLSKVTDAQLKAAGLVRVPGEADELQLTERPGCTSSPTTTGAGSGTGTGLGNPSVHLVALGGGPQGTLLTGLLGGGSTSVNESQLQVGCQIHQVAQADGLPEQEFYIALVVAFTESDVGQNTGGNTTDPNESVGVFQQISNDGWGTIPEELNVTSSAEMFFEGAHNGGDSPEGLDYYYRQDPTAEPYVLAQETQGSGAGAGSDGADNYGTHLGDATALEQKIDGGACKNS